MPPLRALPAAAPLSYHHSAERQIYRARHVPTGETRPWLRVGTRKATTGSGVQNTMVTPSDSALNLLVSRQQLIIELHFKRLWGGGGWPARYRRQAGSFPGR